MAHLNISLVKNSTTESSTSPKQSTLENQQVDALLLKMAEMLIAQGLSLESIANLTGLPLDKITTLK